MDRKEILEGLFDKKVLTILRLLLRHKDEQFYLQEISNKTKVPVATVYRIIQHLVELNLVQQIKIKKFKLYKISESENVIFISSFIEDKISALDEFVSKVKQIEAVEEIILHGKEEETKASILIIGTIIDTVYLKQLVFEIKTKYNFNISMLNLEREQFEQMSQMGLYSGRKKSLYKK